MSKKVILRIIICLTLVAGGMLIGTDEVTGAAKQTVTAGLAKGQSRAGPI